MKNRSLKISSLFFALFIGNAVMAQAPVEKTNSENAIQTQTINGHEVLIFNSIEDKEAWINANPEAYAAKVDEAQQVSVTYIGTLLQVKPAVVKRKAVSTSSSATSPENN
jgi:hypothetical protein